MTYTVRQAPLRELLPAFYPLWARHYAEMAERLESAGIPCSPFNPRVAQYLKSSDEGWLFAFLLECDGEPVGYAQGYITQDMHNQDLIAQEDAIYVLPEHRKGAGRLLLKTVHAEAQKRGVKRLNITTSTDLRVGKWLNRQGYKHTADCMTLTF